MSGPEKIQTSENREARVKGIVEEYIKLGKKLENPPRIVLELATAKIDDPQSLVGARDIGISTAYQCYSPGVSEIKQRRDEKAEITGDSTLDSGHTTTRQHVNYTWHLIGVTRSVTHDTLHSIPFYNTSQQSQRYVEAKEGNYLVPSELTSEQKTFYEEAAEFSNKAYFEMLSILHPAIEERVRSMYPEGGWNVEKTKERLEDKIKKLSQEVARYVLPIAQHTNLDYTISEIQLIRMFIASNNPAFTDEARFIVGNMINEVAKHDPTIWKELREPQKFNNSETVNFDQISQSNKNFDFYLRLGKGNTFMYKPSELISDQLSESVAMVIGSWGMDKNKLLERLLDPALNPLLADVYGSAMFNPMTAVLRQINLSYMTKLSHTGDSQRQRQRMTFGATPPLEKLYSGVPDYMTPLVIRENPKLKEMYDAIVNKEFENVAEALRMGIPKEYALLLLPNALTVRLTENGTLYDWVIRWKERLCFLAQEEIFFLSVDQAEQALKYLPQAENIFLAKCGIREKAGVGKCPEKGRWCGQPVFAMPIGEYKTHRLI